MKTTDLLLKHHRDIEGLLHRLVDPGEADRRAVLQELAGMIVAHTTLEQELLYPAMRSALGDKINETLDEAVEEKGVAAVELARLLAVGTGDETADAKAAVLSELVLNHIHHEEKEVYIVAERELPNNVLNDLRDSMAKRFQQVLDTGYNELLQKALDREVPATLSRTIAEQAARSA